MARLGNDRGPVLRVQQTNVKDGEVFAVTEQDFIEGAFDPAHFEILGYNDYTEVPETDAKGRVVVLEGSGGLPKMVREYRPLADGDRSRIVKAAAAERKDAAAEAKAIAPDADRPAAAKADG